MWRVFTNLIRRARVHQDLDEEVQAHLAILAEEKQRDGLAAPAARRAALLELGGVESVKEQVRDVRAGALVAQWGQDVAFAARMLRRNRTFALTASASLAIGIGAMTAIFSVADALLFKPPVGIPQARSLVDIGAARAAGIAGGRTGGFSQVSYSNYRDLRDHVTSVIDLYAYQPVAEPMGLQLDRQVERIRGTFVSENYFTSLGLQPAAGRLFTTRIVEDSAAVVVLSDAFWRRRFNRDPTIVGRELTMNGQPMTVVGVAPAGFRGTSVLTTDTWLPAAAVPFVKPGGDDLLRRRDLGWMFLGGRLADGMPLATAQAELDGLASTLTAEYPTDNVDLRFRVVPATPIPGNLLPVGPFLSVLAVVVGVVLTVACANVAGVLVARAAARRREIAVRVALGATRGRLIRQLVTETLVLFVTSAALGLWMAGVMTRMLVALLPNLPIPVDVSVPLDWRALVFTVGVCLFTALLTGLAPAWQAVRAEGRSMAANSGRGLAASSKLHRGFVVGQVALTLILVLTAGLFMRGLQRGSAVDLGFETTGIDVVSLDLSLAGMQAGAHPTVVRSLMARIRALPDIERASVLMTGAPVGDGVGLALLTVPGVSPPDGASAFQGDWNAVDTDYFATLQIPLIRGRDFTDTDVAGAQPVAIVGKAAADRFWPGEDPIGKTIAVQSGRLHGPVSLRGPRQVMTVVGVARDLRYFGPTDDTIHLHVYAPLAQQFSSRVTVVARGRGNQRPGAEIRAVIASMVPSLPLVDVRSLDDVLAIALVPQRVALFVSGALGLVGLVLACFGLYGVIAYRVAQRTREFGIRLALGAAPARVVFGVVSEGIALVAVGIALGTLASLALGPMLRGFLLGVSVLDPMALGVAVVLFAGAGLAACTVPARRAIAVDVVDALRIE